MAFQYFTDNLFIQHDDMYMRVFTQNLEVDAQKWFRVIHAATIRSMDELETTFMKKWGEKRDHMH